MNIQEWEHAYRKTRRKRILRRLRIRRFALPPNAVILDLGCGDGLDTQLFLEHGYRHIVALDSSLQLLKAIPARRFPAVVGNGYKLPFRDEVFDVVYANSVLHHLPRVVSALTEVRRVIRPGGLLCFTEPEPGLWRRVIDWITLSPMGSCLPGVRHRTITLREELPLMAKWLESFPYLRRHLQECGFEILMWKRSLLSIQAKCMRGA